MAAQHTRRERDLPVLHRSLDLNYLEESSDTAELTLALLPRSGQVNLVEVSQCGVFRDKARQVVDLVGFVS